MVNTKKYVDLTGLQIFWEGIKTNIPKYDDSDLNAQLQTLLSTAETLENAIDILTASKTQNGSVDYKVDQAVITLLGGANSSNNTLNKLAGRIDKVSEIVDEINTWHEDHQSAYDDLYDRTSHIVNNGSVNKFLTEQGTYIELPQVNSAKHSESADEAEYAANSGSAEFASKDAEGNEISSTYAKLIDMMRRNVRAEATQVDVDDVNSYVTKAEFDAAIGAINQLLDQILG
ncbi:MAG: hypothetical protein IKU29_05175 [Parabacteroides sp.]|nr:hypothetical protein [Parabacteroides sp.]